MPDLVIDRAVGYVNLLLFSKVELSKASCTVILAPYFLLCLEMAWSQVKTEATMWYIIRSRTAEFRIVNWVSREGDHLTFLPSSFPEQARNFSRVLIQLRPAWLEYNHNKKNWASLENAQILNFPAVLSASLLQNSALPCFGSVLKKRGKIQNLSIF